MDINQRVLWAEGVFLSQQHFQQWEQGLNQHRQLSFQYQLDKIYGICELIIDETQIAVGICKVLKLLCLMPDGRWLYFQDHFSKQPLTISLTNQEEDIFVALPYQESVAGISGYPDQTSKFCAWRADYQSVTDLYDSSRQQEVLCATQQFFLTNDQTISNECCLIQIGKFAMNADKRYQQDQIFIAPYIQIKNSPTLFSLVHYLQEELSLHSKKIKELLQANQNRAVRDNEFLRVILMSLARYQVQLRNIELEIYTSPKYLYTTLVEMIMELRAVNLADQIRLPNFSMETLGQIFTTLKHAVVSCLNEIYPTPNATLSLQKINKDRWYCTDINSVIKPGAALYLEVSGLPSDSEFASNQFIQGVQLGALDKIDDIYASAVGGIKLTAVTRLPAAISAKPNCEYFQIHCQGLYWQQVLETGDLALLTSNISWDINMELILVEA